MHVHVVYIRKRIVEVFFFISVLLKLGLFTFKVLSFILHGKESYLYPLASIRHFVCNLGLDFAAAGGGHS